jgi:chemotaxis protein histidine kinase CheA/CheY-like chemotaxis protein
MVMNQSDELMSVFRDEAAELIDKIMLRLKALGTTSKIEDRRETLASLLRLVHNLKGASKTVGKNEAAALIHTVEERLQPFRDDAKSIPQKSLEQLVEAVTLVQLMIDGKAKPESQEPSAETVSTGLSERDTSIKVDTSRFDRVMGFSGELLVSHARMNARHRKLDRFVKTLQQLAKLSDDNSKLLVPVLKEARQIVQDDRKDLLDFNNLVTEIGDAMKQVRMVPLKRAEPRWRSIVREVAHHCGKQVNLAIYSGNIEIDKHVLDQLGDPMLHLLRNAVDHGVESSEERAAAGKSPAGHILVTASVQGAMVQIEVNDDGRGIDLEKVRTAAVAQGLVTADKSTHLNDEETINLLFHSGFSTAGQVSQISGRGVGLDVVRSQIEELGGSITISSSKVLGGTSFQLSVPLSILLTLGLFVRVGDTSYALPVEYVTRMLRIPSKHVGLVDGKTVIPNGKDDPIRLVWLADLVGNKKKSDHGLLRVLVLSRSDMRLAIAVDEVEEQHEFVIQALPWNFESVPGVNGVIVQADGRLAVSVDVPHLFDQAQLAAGDSLRSADTSSLRATYEVLVVDDSMASRTLGRNILQTGGYAVTVAADGQQAWEIIQKKPFDLVISDVDMPKMNGLELTRKIRADNSTNDLPVILVSGLDSRDDVAAGADAGADEYVVKGTFDQGTLLELVAKYLDGHD